MPVQGENLLVDYFPLSHSAKDREKQGKGDDLFGYYGCVQTSTFFVPWSVSIVYVRGVCGQERDNRTPNNKSKEKPKSQYLLTDIN